MQPWIVYPTEVPELLGMPGGSSGLSSFDLQFLKLLHLGQAGPYSRVLACLFKLGQQGVRPEKVLLGCLLRSKGRGRRKKLKDGAQKRPGARETEHQTLVFSWLSSSRRLSFSSSICLKLPASLSLKQML